MNTIRQILLLPALVCAGSCAVLPDPWEADNLDLTVSRIYSGPVATDAADCASQIALEKPETPGELPAEDLRLVSWNIQKGANSRWLQDLERIEQGSELLLLQEANDAMAIPRRAGSRLISSFAPGYRNARLRTGLMTYSASVPLTQCNLITLEPWLRTPKATLVTEYGLSQTDQNLVVVNVHGVNFSFGVTEFQRQIDQIRTVLESHDGPIVLAGDFNTWRGRRARIVETLVRDLSLHAPDFGRDHRTRVMGWPLDHVYVRGLTAGQVDSEPVRSSDHNPLMLSLAL